MKKEGSSLAELDEPPAPESRRVFCDACCGIWNIRTNSHKTRGGKKAFSAIILKNSK
jgi:hypothetical protein